MGAEAMTEADLGAILLEYGKAWNENDPDAIAAFHTEDTRFNAHGVSETVEGRDAMREAAADYFEQFPQFRSEPRAAHFGPSHWVLEWTVINGENRVDCVDVVLLEGGLIKTKDTYFDVAQYKAANPD